MRLGRQLDAYTDMRADGSTGDYDTAVGNSPEQARAAYRRAEELLRAEGRSAQADLTVDTAPIRE